MAKPIASDCGQQFLVPPAVEDWMAPDHPARFLRETAAVDDHFIIPQGRSR